MFEIIKEGGNIKLKGKQEKFLLALLNQPNIARACEEAGISRKTGHNYLKDKKFSDELMRQRREIMRRTTGMIQQASADVVAILHDIVKDNEQPASARVQAGRTILEYGYKGLELEDFRTRLEEIEETIEYDT